MITDVLVWNKYSRIIKRLAERLNLSDLQAISLFYKSRVYRVLSDKSSLLITQPEMYIVDELVEELNDNGIRLMMDLPIGVSPSGADTWSRKGIFLLDENSH